MERGKTSGRSDDNIESIKKRFDTFLKESMPVVDMFEKESKVETVDATPSREEVYKDTKTRLANRDIYPNS